jgi:hypothetical protein
MKRVLALVTVLALAMAPMATRIEAAAASTGLSVPIAGSGTSAAGETVTFNGSFRVTRFVNSGGQILAQGVLTGIATKTVGSVATGGSVVTASESIVRTVSMAVDTTQQTAAAAAAAPMAVAPISTQAVCDVLHLVLGPLHLDLLGLVVDLNRVVLDITAESGPGNLLGNLLCAVVGLLDGGGSTNSIVTVLNQILGALGGLSV